VSNKRSARKSSECENVARKVKEREKERERERKRERERRRGKILNQGIYQRSKISALGRSQKRSMEWSYSDVYRHFQSGLRT